MVSGPDAASCTPHRIDAVEGWPEREHHLAPVRELLDLAGGAVLRRHAGLTLDLGPETERPLGMVHQPQRADPDAEFAQGVAVPLPPIGPNDASVRPPYRAGACPACGVPVRVIDPVRPAPSIGRGRCPKRVECREDRRGIAEDRPRRPCFLVEGTVVILVARATIVPPEVHAVARERKVHSHALREREAPPAPAMDHGALHAPGTVDRPRAGGRGIASDPAFTGRGGRDAHDFVGAGPRNPRVERPPDALCALGVGPGGVDALVPPLDAPRGERFAFRARDGAVHHVPHQVHR
jgi:hypothetical protein